MSTSNNTITTDISLKTNCFQSPHVIASPVIDIIRKDTFEYTSTGKELRGGRFQHDGIPIHKHIDYLLKSFFHASYKTTIKSLHYLLCVLESAGERKIPLLMASNVDDVSIIVQMYI